MAIRPTQCSQGGGLRRLASEAADAVLAGDLIASPVTGPVGSPKILVNEIVASPGSPAVVAGASMTEYRNSGADSFMLPGIAARRQRRLPSRCLEMPSSSPKCGEASPEKVRRKPRRLLSLKTPSSCASAAMRQDWTPCTPDPARADLRIIEGDVRAMMFDFDGTLTATQGEAAQRSRKQAELQLRAPMLRPRLQHLREEGVLLGIISKSSELTIQCALREAGLEDLFEGPVVPKAVGFEGKAGFIADLVEAGALGDLGPDGLSRVLLVDDDVRELDRARARGIQTYAAPLEGGLQEEDFDEICASLGLGPAQMQSPGQALPSSPEAWPELAVQSSEQRSGWTWLRPEWCRNRGGG
mmetsp:Transcript_91766/g.268590  ORF Transcript_91766/g.268590 Transcript_91766/m.268590 type:complete len:356 (-) Transcript_91766:123-1190(-)